MLVFLTLPFVSTLMIVLNVYNGDILNIEENTEYMLWYIPLLVYISFLKICLDIKLKTLLPELSIAFFGIVINIYWIYAWKNDSKTNFRHRTEYYDSQCLLCSFCFVVLLNYFNNHYKDSPSITNV